MLSINFKGGLHRMKLTKVQKETIKDIAGAVTAGAFFIAGYMLLYLIGGGY